MLSNQRAVGGAVCVAIAMLLCLFGAGRTRSAIAALAVLSFAWFAMDNAFEGPVILPVLPRHGVTVADLPGIAALLTAAVLWRRSFKR